MGTSPTSSYSDEIFHEATDENINENIQNEILSENNIKEDINVESENSSQLLNLKDEKKRTSESSSSDISTSTSLSLPHDVAVGNHDNQLDDNDGDKTPVVAMTPQYPGSPQMLSPQTTPTKSEAKIRSREESVSSKSLTTSMSSVKMEIPTFETPNNLDFEDHDSAPESERINFTKNKKTPKEKEVLADQLTDDIFNNLLTDAFSAAKAIRNKPKENKQIKSPVEGSRDFPAKQQMTSLEISPKLTSSAKSLLQMITSQSDDVIEEKEQLEDKRETKDE